MSAHANPQKGEMQVEIGGRTYVLVMTFNALLRVQQLFNRAGVMPTADSIVRAANNGDLESMRALFWALLLRHQPDLTVEQVGDLIDEAGGVEAVNELIDRAHAASAPDPKDIAELAPHPLVAPGRSSMPTLTPRGGTSTSSRGASGSRRTTSGG